MKSKSSAIIAILALALTFAGCGKSAPSPAGGTAAAGQPAAEVPAAAAPAASGLRTIADMANAWNALFGGNEKAINDYQGMPIMGLVTPPLAFASAVQFDIMNPRNQDGRFTGKMMLAGYQGFLERAGSRLSFGYDDKLQKDGFGPLNKAGDRVAGSGSLALDPGYFIWETFNERGGQKIQRDYTEFKRLADGSMICIALSGQAFDMRGEPGNKDEAIFLHNGPGRYDFVIANGKTGPGFAAISFADKGDLDKAQALELLKAAGYEIEQSGGIQGGKLVLDAK